MEHLSRPDGAIAVIAKVLRDDFGVGENFAHVLSIVVEAGGMRREAGHDGGAGGIASRAGAMGIGEKNTAFGEAVEVGRDALVISAHAADPVIQVIHGDEEDVGFLAFG